MLDVNAIYKTFNAGTVNEKAALRGVSLHLDEGDFVTVIGGNGAGKSTLLNAVAGVWPVDEGTISVGGVDLTRMPEHKRAKYIGRVFQDPMMGTAATMQIEENLALAARRGQSRTLRAGITRAERAEYVERLKILDLGLEDRLTSKVGLLSGGQRQALTLLMATLRKPKLLLLDEHTAALVAAAAFPRRRMPIPTALKACPSPVRNPIMYSSTTGRTTGVKRPGTILRDTACCWTGCTPAVRMPRSLSSVRSVESIQKS